MDHVFLLSIQKQSFVLKDKHPSALPCFLLLLPCPLSPVFSRLFHSETKNLLCAENLALGVLLQYFSFHSQSAD